MYVVCGSYRLCWQVKSEHRLHGVNAISNGMDKKGPLSAECRNYCTVCATRTLALTEPMCVPLIHRTHVRPRSSLLIAAMILPGSPEESGK
jgi:hypothetical protein